MQLPPHQQLAAPGKWPVVGERQPAGDDRPWTLAITGLVARPLRLSLAELQAGPVVERTIDIHCVTRWSKPAVVFRGMLLADVLAQAEVLPAARFVSFVARSERKHSTSLPLADALDLGAIVTWEADGRPLDSPHGGPLRVITPGRYFYKSIKWLAEIELLAEDRLGYWEAVAGYHNEADPWLEQRYMAAEWTPQALRTVLAQRDFRQQSLRSLAAAGHALDDLRAEGALLRDADFRAASLKSAQFSWANLANARLDGADLRGASFLAADLEGTSFIGANLCGADLRQASLFGATFAGEESGRIVAPGAHFDANTSIDPAAIEQLTPLQAEWVWTALKAAQTIADLG